jgi:hypothetical protein
MTLISSLALTLSMLAAPAAEYKWPGSCGDGWNTRIINLEAPRY